MSGSDIPSERGALLDQLELQLADLEEDAAEVEAAAEKFTVPAFERRKPARLPLPAHLPRERVVYPTPSVCPCCGGDRLRKIGEFTLTVIVAGGSPMG